MQVLFPSPRWRPAATPTRIRYVPLLDVGEGGGPFMRNERKETERVRAGVAAGICEAQP